MQALKIVQLSGQRTIQGHKVGKRYRVHAAAQSNLGVACFERTIGVCSQSYETLWSSDSSSRILACHQISIASQFLLPQHQPRGRRHAWGACLMIGAPTESQQFPHGAREAPFGCRRTQLCVHYTLCKVSLTGVGTRNLARLFTDSVPSSIPSSFKNCFMKVDVQFRCYNTSLHGSLQLLITITNVEVGTLDLFEVLSCEVTR
jgi:hypothetical protein